MPKIPPQNKQDKQARTDGSKHLSSGVSYVMSGSAATSVVTATLVTADRDDDGVPLPATAALLATATSVTADRDDNGVPLPATAALLVAGPSSDDCDDSNEVAPLTTTVGADLVGCRRGRISEVSSLEDVSPFCCCPRPARVEAT